MDDRYRLRVAYSGDVVIWKPLFTWRLLVFPLGFSLGTWVIFRLRNPAEFWTWLPVVALIYFFSTFALLNFWTCDWRRFPVLHVVRIAVNFLSYASAMLVAMFILFIATWTPD